MKKITLSILLMFTAILCQAQAVFVNEIHYDNAGADVGEFIEIAGPAGTDLAGWTLELYNGSNGLVYNSETLSGIIPDEGSGFGALAFPITGIQNGGPDGIALVNGGTVEQFLSYEGTFTANDGPASGMTSTDIGVAESSATPAGNSLQLTGTGTAYPSFTWMPDSAESPGLINAGQTFVMSGGGNIMITCPADISADTAPGLCTAQVFFGDAIASDPDGDPVTVTQTAGPSSMSDFPVGDTTIEFTATNDNDPTETATCTFIITVNDVEAPEITCVSDITVDNDPGVCGAVVTYDLPTVTDNCPEDPAGFTLIAGFTSGSSFPVGTTTVTYEYADSGSNTATCSFNVTVNDVEAPMAPNCMNLTVDLDANGMATINATDLVEQTTTGLFAIAAFNGGTNDVGRYSYNPVNDAITLEDNPFASTGIGQIFGFDMNPVTGQAYMIIAGAGRELVEYDIDSNTFGTNFGTLTSSSGSGNANSLAFAPDGTLYITFSGGGGGGSGEPTQIDTYDFGTNTTTAFTTAPNNGGVGLTYDSDNNQLVYATLDAGFSNPEVSLIDATGAITTTFAIDATDITCGFGTAQAMEYVGNGKVIASSTFGCDILYTIDLVAETSTTLLAPNGFSSSLKGLLYIPAEDNCGPVTITASAGGATSGSISTLFAGGNGGATGGAVYFDITVGAADINVTSIDVNTGEGGAFTLDVYTEEGTFAGNEADTSFWGAADAMGSGTGAGANLPSNAVLDTNITLSANTTYAVALVLDAAHAFDYTDGDGTNQNYDNGDLALALGSATNVPFTNPTFAPRVFNGGINYEFTAASDVTVTFDCSNVGENMVEVFATDASGNSTSCMAIVTVNDVTAPVLVCQDITVELDENGEASIEPEDLLAETPAVFNVMTIGSNNGSGAFGATDFTVPVTAAATVTFDWDYTTADAAGFDSFGYLLNGTYTELTNPAVGNQSGSATVAVAPGDVFGFRSDTVDNTFGGNETVISNFAPGFDGQFAQENWTLTLDNSDGDAFFVEAIPAGPLSFDACGIEVIAINVSGMFTCDDIAGSPYAVQVFASDASNNAATCTSMVTVVDLLAPVFTCPEDQTVETDPTSQTYTFPDYFATGEASALDNCTDVADIVTTQDPAPGTEMGISEDNVVTLTATDEYGNTSTCTFEVDIVVEILSIEENDLDTAVTMYPNPANNQVTISNGSNIALDKAVIYDTNGKLINTIDLRTMQSEQVIDVASLATGVYMIQISSENASIVKRLIKQ